VANSSDPLVVQLEDALRWGAPIVGVFLGGILFLGLGPAVLLPGARFILGGVLGYAFTFLAIVWLFRLINPRREGQHQLPVSHVDSNAGLSAMSDNPYQPPQEPAPLPTAPSAAPKPIQLAMPFWVWRIVCAVIALVFVGDVLTRNRPDVRPEWLTTLATALELVAALYLLVIATARFVQQQPPPPIE
jgi:hypothetical protein